MKSYSVDLDQMLMARERRASIQSAMLQDSGPGQCLVCLTMNIAGDIKRTPMTRMLFDAGISEMNALGFNVRKEFLLDESTGSEAFWLLDEDGAYVKEKLEALGYRVEVDKRNEKTGRKIRDAQVEKVPYMIVVGDRDMEAGTLAPRHRSEGDLGTMSFDDFLALLKDDVDNKKIK